MVCRYSSSAKGIEDLIARLAQIGEDVDAAAARALIAGGDEILVGILRNVPVGNPAEDPHAGLLKRTLERTEPKMNGNYIFVEVGMPRKTLAYIARYGNAQEYGYRRGGKQYPPQSYIRKGFDERKAAFRKALKASLEKDGML